MLCHINQSYIAVPIYIFPGRKRIILVIYKKKDYYCTIKLYVNQDLIYQREAPEAIIILKIKKLTIEGCFWKVDIYF